MAFNVKDFWTFHLGKLLACNAADGPEHGLCGPDTARVAFERAVQSYDLAPPARRNAEVFEKMLTQACWGPDAPKPPDRPINPPYAEISYEKCEGFSDNLSTVITASTLCRLLSLEDRQRFALEHGIDIPSSLEAGADTAWIEELGRLAHAERRFHIKVDEGHGRPLVWFTRQEEITGLLSSKPRPGFSLADVVRDYLGLIHHGPTVPHGAIPNHLFVLDIPASAALRAGHWRPSAIDGVDNRRFMVHGSPARAAWGTTFDLESFASKRSGGGSERVLLRLQRELLLEDTLGFSYIGRVTQERGTMIGFDDDEAFLKFVLRDRNIASLIAAIYP